MATVGSVFLFHIPAENRPALFSSLINALQPEDSPSIDFVASAVAAQGGDVTQSLLLEFLLRSIDADKPNAAISIARKHSKIGESLFTQSAATISKARSENQHVTLDRAVVASHLRFCKSIFSQLPVANAHTEVLSAAVLLLANADQDICNGARDLIFAALLGDNQVVMKDVLGPHYPAIWTQIQHLVAPDRERWMQVLGYSLWLRWLLSGPHTALELYISDVYWNLILQGLRHGDAEIRKLCLNILKLSLVASPNAVSLGTRKQFERYGTVFETIVLGRYINQIQECEGDLDDLASDSLLDSKWLYALLASALSPQMQDSNRKFIGNWVMRAGLRSGNELASFLQGDFFPWAVQGSLFVGSLKTNDRGETTCSHGERLANYLTTILKHSESSEEVRAITWSYVTSKQTFAYAKVWMLKALTESMQGPSTEHAASGPSVKLSHADSHSEEFSERILLGLPDAARDYVAKKLRVLKLQVPFASDTSRRNVLEREAIAQCKTINTADDLDELWGDLDYLEFPKGLLFHVPPAMLSNNLVMQALTDDQLASSLRNKVITLQKVAQTKTYLISPLNCALRNAALSNPQAFDTLGMTDYIIHAVSNPLGPTIDLMLEESTVHLFAKYEEYFGEPPSFGIAALLDLISRLRDRNLLEDLVNRIMQRWKAQKVPPPTVSAWKTTLQLQSLLLCLENLQPSADHARELILDLLRVLSIEPLPRYRYLLEWMTVRLLQRMKLEQVVLDQLTSKDHHANPKYLASLMKIGSIIGCSQSSSEAFATELATLYVPLAASSKIVIRHEAQWQVPILFEHAQSRGWTAITDNPALGALDDYIRSLERFHAPHLERQIGRCDPETHHTLTNLVEGAWFGLDSIESPLTSRDEFIKLYAAGLPSDAPGSCMPLGEPTPQRFASIPSQDAKPAAAAAAPAPRTIDDVTALQTKGTAYLARTLSDPTASTARPNNLIVVGSLVDNPYNLGGLSRVSEIFGASALTLQNQNVIGNRDFTSVSVSSHLHFPIIQLSAPGVPAFLAERKAEGFTVVGTEQTDRSVILGSEGAKLPEKCVLVVGSEKEGIPAVVLTECDVLVEIPQKGVTRSLNVQTAVSVVLFEYARQHCGK